MRPIEEIQNNRNIDVRQRTPDGGAGTIVVNGKKCTLVFSWGGGWEHVSIAPYDKKTPTWEDMCKVKRMFWEDDEAVVQIHPKREDYVNRKKNCLHLWRPIDQELPLPPKLYV